MRPPHVLGIDASLTSTGLCAIPLNWDLDWSRVRAATIKRSLPENATERDRIERMSSIARDVRVFAIQFNVRHAWIEALPTHGGSTFNVTDLAELRGFIRKEFAEDHQLRLTVELANQSTIRKLLLGRLPPSDRKAAVVGALDCMTAECVIQPFEDGDQKDAFVVANYGLSELAAPCIALPAPEVAKAAKKTRARAA